MKFPLFQILLLALLISVGQSGHARYAYIIDTTQQDIDRVDLVDGGETSLVSGLQDPVSVTVAGPFLFWAQVDLDGPEGGIWRANRDGTGAARVVATEFPRGVEIHGGHIYYSASEIGGIFRTNLDGGGKTVVIQGPAVGFPEELVIWNGKIYWHDGNRIAVCNVDGTGAGTLISGLDDVTSLAKGAGRIWWTQVGISGFGSGIHSVHPDGGGYQLFETREFPRGVAVAGGNVFWTDSETSQLSSRALAGGSVESESLASGFPTDLNVSGFHSVRDVDRDGLTDVGIYRAGTWFRHGSAAGSLSPVSWGGPGDIPVGADFDGDGFSDLSVFRPSTGQWFINATSTGVQQPITFGVPGDLPAAADWDGDGLADIAVYRPWTGQWFRYGSSDGPMPTIVFGSFLDIPVPLDYSGDQVADLLVFRPSSATWYGFDSEGAPLNPFVYGAPTDFPVPGNYLQAGETIPSVFRPGTAEWILGFHTPVPFGLPGDQPVR